MWTLVKVAKQPLIYFIFLSLLFFCFLWKTNGGGENKISPNLGSLIVIFKSLGYPFEKFANQIY
jgi:uncharacterized membrane protein (DUF106 family)